MEAIQYVKSVPRYLATRFFGNYWQGLYTSSLGCLKKRQIPLPPLPSQKWVRVRPLVSGICGSDLATLMASTSPFFSPMISTPFVMGHEVVGLVEELGNQVPELEIGDRVVLQPPLHCRVREIDYLCPQCSAGEDGRCENITRGVISAGIQTGFCRDTGGGWSESLVAHYLQLHRIPAAFDAARAVLVEPFSCCLHASELVQLREDQSIVIMGCGTMGILTIAAIRLRGFGCKIIAVAKYAHQAEVARAVGADTVVQAGGGALSELTGLLDATAFQPELGRPTVLGGADLIFDCVGSSRTLDDALRLTRSGGTVIVVGMPSIPKGLDWTSMWYKEIQIRGSYTSNTSTFRQAVEMMALFGDRFQGLVDARFPLDQYKEAIDCALNSGTRGTTKAAFVFED